MPEDTTIVVERAEQWINTDAFQAEVDTYLAECVFDPWYEDELDFLK